MIILSIIITLLYLILIASFVFGFDKVNAFKIEDSLSVTKFSMVIPFRNEADNLPQVLNSIEALQYPTELFEVIFVNDESEDNSVELLTEATAHCLNISIVLNERHSNSPKKDAISTAIKIAKNEWIITTDADCFLPKFWLNCFDEYIQKTNAICIAAPVTYIDKNNFLSRFQLLDMLSLQAATIGGFGVNKPFLCNGANFAYRKEFFNTVNGFEGNTDTASGDDIFLLEKAAKKYPEQLHYLKNTEAVVLTKSQPTWVALVSQRVRWAAKTSAYNNMFGKFTGLIVLFMNTLIITSALLALVGAFNVKVFIYLLIIKFNIDFYLIYKSAVFFNQRIVLKSYIVAFLFYPIFSVYVAISSIFSNYTWKGRSFKK